jgi:hypothetical protein
MSPGPFPPETQAQVDRLEPADLVVVVPRCGTVEGLRAAAEATRAGVPDVRAVIVHPNTVDDADAVRSPTGAATLQALPCRLPAVSGLPLTTEDARILFGQLAVIGGHVGARAYAFAGALPEGIFPATIQALVHPVIAVEFDLVLPAYARHKFDGLINRAVVYPLTRALFGKRATGQLGVDFGLSTRMLSGVFDHQNGRGPGASIWLLTEAVERNFQVCEAHVGTFLPPFESADDVSAALARVLGSLFEDMDRHAPMWQRVRGSQPVRTFGEPNSAADEPRAVDVSTMVESFHLGFRNLQEIWSRVLPPATLVELGRLSRAPLDRFLLPDALWARIVFDFALGHRLRSISRDHLLRAMTPLYLAWVASFVLEVGEADQAAVQTRLERLCLSYETEKPYLIARWRWPDRFNP